MQDCVSNLTMYTIVFISLALLTSFRHMQLSLGAMIMQEAKMIIMVMLQCNLSNSGMNVHQCFCYSNDETKKLIT